MAKTSLVAVFLIASVGLLDSAGLALSSCFCASCACKGKELAHAIMKQKAIVRSIFMDWLPFDIDTLNASGGTKWIAIENEEVGFLADLK